MPNQKDYYSFDTVKREYASSHPSSKISDKTELHKLFEPHILSFNAITEYDAQGGILDHAIEDIPRVYCKDGNNNSLQLWIEKVTISHPTISEKSHLAMSRKLYPAECRERQISYKGKLNGKICWRINNGPIMSEVKRFGDLPIMIKSNLCHLKGMSPKQLIAAKEEAEEFGGYFIINGIERIIRLLILQRAHQVLAITRPSFQSRGAFYTKYACQIRCVKRDQSSLNNFLHFLTNGNCQLRFIWRRQECVIPVMMILKALVSASDKEIFDSIVQPADSNNTFLCDQVELLIRDFKRFSLLTQEQCLEYLGSKFFHVLSVPDDMPNAEVGRELLKRTVLVHLENFRDKFNLLIFMLKKLYSVADGTSAEDNLDSTMNHEVLTGGFFYCSYLKAKFQEWLVSIKSMIDIEIRRKKTEADFFKKDFLKKVFDKAPSDIGRKLEYMLATGNVNTEHLDLIQTSGFTIVAEKLNYYRYLSHFRCIHRGAFFAELKTTSVRKLLPESWGFLCPVHTPDGSPCGLLNHLSHLCQIINHPIDSSFVTQWLVNCGMSPIVDHRGGTALPNLKDTLLHVLLDGKIVGYGSAKAIQKAAEILRFWKVTGKNNIPKELEIGFVPQSNGGQYPGLYLFSSPSRMMRPTKHLATGQQEMIGSFEQVYMDIACLNEDIVPGVTTHQDFAPTNMLSVVANLTPFSDFNQSPRNMYQCQMGKQTMGTPAQAYAHRTDNKLYRIQTPQTPIVRPKMHDVYNFDEYPNGTNAIVAVISYTGYDMEDAMIINKSAAERHFGYGSIIKCERIDLMDFKTPNQPMSLQFGIGDRDDLAAHIDVDGLPLIGSRVNQDDPICAYVNTATGKVTVKRYKSSETGFVEEVRLLGNDAGDAPCTKIIIKYRIPRPPIIGDKFSSRHGQKGVCSTRFPAIDLPFSESGMVPDVIINPHAFPSRMTIGMLIESLAGKSGSLHGMAYDSTPFTFTEDFPASDYFGEQLLKAGYNYHGNEPMYSGITGQEFKADIYIGCVYYQRLRHMVSDKYQVRATGPVHDLTQQPVKGRKRGGGVRFGEMERDSLLAHGVSYLLQDRLMNCSDYSTSHICSSCGSIISPLSLPLSSMEQTQDNIGSAAIGGSVSSSSFDKRHRNVICKTCNSSKNIKIVPIPYVFRYLTTELMAMNIQLRLEVH